MIVKVPSDSDPSRVYEVNTESGECSCPQFQKRLKELNEKDGGERVCKHVPRAREQGK